MLGGQKTQKMLIANHDEYKDLSKPAYGIMPIQPFNRGYLCPLDTTCYDPCAFG